MPIFRDTEINLNREKDVWILKLRDKSINLFLNMNDCMDRIKNLKRHDRISDALAIVDELNQIKNEIENFFKEVTIFFVEYSLLYFLNSVFFLLRKIQLNMKNEYWRLT
jgi:hypothetical protein